jgi:hypothetical protein
MMILEKHPELTTLDGGSFRETECVKQKKNWMTKGRFFGADIKPRACACTCQAHNIPPRYIREPIGV